MSHLWVDGNENGSPGNAIRLRVKDVVDDVNRQVASRGTRAVNAIRNAELEVLKGQRSGKKYRKPYTKHATYTASAPGEPPARRTGNLRLHWNGQVKSKGKANGGVQITAELESQEEYADALENGKGMAPRPFVERIKEKATPEIERIYNEPYS